MKRLYVLVAVIAIVAFMPATPAVADDDKKLKADPFEFVGTARDCAPSPAGTNIVTAAWLDGMGLPDNDGSDPKKKDQRSGLLLSKNGPTADCSSAGAEIKGVRGMTVDATFTLGFDYRLGGHCGAGAPRFNVDTDRGFFFVGCANAPQSPAPQDPTQWKRTRSVLVTCGAECSPGPVPAGAKIKSISILFDEGTDTASNDTEGVGLAVIDNIFINGAVITDKHGSD